MSGCAWRALTPRPPALKVLSIDTVIPVAGEHHTSAINGDPQKHATAVPFTPLFSSIESLLAPETRAAASLCQRNVDLFRPSLRVTTIRRQQQLDECCLPRTISHLFRWEIVRRLKSRSSVDRHRLRLRLVTSCKPCNEIL